ncbi:MAG TPA: TonB-dependent receptor [Woeseiaceae bacterium]|nr:TonB-dependent receptor [Woeseiaceae bacterium]
MSFLARLGVIAALLIACHGVSVAEQSWQGVQLEDYIDDLRSRGLRIIYSTDLVREDYRVQVEPDADDPEAALREVLAPYGLTLTTGPAGTLLITRAPAESPNVNVHVVDLANGMPVTGARLVLDGRQTGVTDEAGRFVMEDVATGQHELRASASGYEGEATAVFTASGADEVTVRVALDPGPAPLPEIIVTSSHYDIRYQQAGSHTFLDRELTTKLPHLGDEALRTIARLPGATSGGLSSRHHVRGGLQNEQLFLLDGLRLYEPYHLKDFHSITTIVPSGAIAGMNFYSAGYQARYGDRMSGVVDIELREPPEESETELGLTFFHASALSRGRFGGNDRGDWLVSGRRANLDLIADVVNPEYGAPRYQDYLAHVGWDIGGHYLSGNALFSNDKISLAQTDGSERASARYKNDVLWLKAESEWSERLGSRTIISATEIENRRSGVTEKPGVIEGFVEDEREFRSLAFKQDWLYSMSDRWLLSAGVELKRLEANYRYDAALMIAPPFDSVLDNRPFQTRAIDTSPRGAQYAGYTEVRWRPADSVAVDVGLRWDQQTYTTATDDEQMSPRINLLWRMSDRTDLRLAFGQYYQAQEINELQVSDNVVDFHPAQRARHLVASLTHVFPTGTELRFEAYQKKYYGLMPRFENVFDPLVLIPELQIDRVRVDADRATAEGLEITLSGEGERDLSWWAGYAWSRSEDELDGLTVRRGWDQRHSVSAGISRDWSHWSVSAVALIRSGWPKTVLLADAIREDEMTDLFLSVEPRNSRRHEPFQSLDVRISRRFDLPRGELTAFLEVTNLLNHDNPCCSEYSIEIDGNDNQLLVSDEGTWLPIVPSLGVLWRF